jgi:PleD family two-component response regulator
MSGDMDRTKRSIADAPNAGAAGEPPVARLRILVVDDDIVDFEALQRALKRMETYRVEAVWAKNPEKARYYLETREFDVVFVDYHLGLNTGSRLLQEMGGREARHVAILITGLASRHVQQMALMAGAVHCMSKDEIDARTLETAIRYALFTHALEQKLYRQVIEHKLAQNAVEQQLLQHARALSVQADELLAVADAIEAALHARDDSTLRQRIAQLRGHAGELRGSAQTLAARERADRVRPPALGDEPEPGAQYPPPDGHEGH